MTVEKTIVVKMTINNVVTKTIFPLTLNTQASSENCVRFEGEIRAWDGGGCKRTLNRAYSFQGTLLKKRR